MNDLLYAPWRMAYILGDKPQGCIFCEYPARGVSPETLVLHVAEHAFVVLNRYPYINGHVMVIPRAHVSHVADLEPAAHAATAQLLQATAGILRTVLRPDGMNLGMNVGHAAGAGIDSHVHYHIVPRWVGDSNFVDVVGGTRVLNEGLDATFAKLAPHFAHLPT